MIFTKKGNAHFTSTPTNILSLTFDIRIYDYENRHRLMYYFTADRIRTELSLTGKSKFYRP